MSNNMAVLAAALVIALVCLAGTGYSLLREQPSGPMGIQGAQGVPGPQGVQGPMGMPGLNGKDGAKGNTGSTGASGSSGPTGPMGPSGLNGTNGVNGTDGADGETGPQGEQGEQGEQGLQGEQGEQGSPGEDGEDGMDAPINIPSYQDCLLNGSYKWMGVHHDHLIFNLSVSICDPDDDTVVTTVYYKEDSEDDWEQLWMTTDEAFNCSKVFSYYSAPGSKTLWWLVLSWDGSDLSDWSGNYTVMAL